MKRLRGKINPHLKTSIFGLYSFWREIGRFLTLFQDLDLHLHRAGLKTDFRVYLSLAFLSTAIIALATFVSVPLIFLFVFHSSMFSAVLFGLGSSLFAVAISVFGFYLYPVYRADKLQRELDDELAFASGYMAILASAGVSPEKFSIPFQIFLYL